MSPKKKILIKVTNNSEFTSSSGELVTLTALVAMLKTKYQVRYYGLDDIYSATEQHQLHNNIKNNCQIKILRRLISIPIAIINSYCVIKNFRPDLLMCIGGVYYNGLCILIIGKIFGIPTLVRTAEDHYRVAKLQDNFKETLKHKLVILPLSHFVLKSCSHALTVGHHSASYLARILKREVYSCRSPILLNNTNFKKTKKDTKILYVGTLNKLKGSHELNEFLRLALSENSTWTFTFVGTDKSPQKYIKKIFHDFPEQVNIYSPIPNDELISFYRKSEFLIFTTKVGIGYGLVTLEAEKQGCEVIAIRPRLDAKSIHKSYSILEAVERIKSGCVMFRGSQDPEEDITQLHLKVFKQILKNKE